MPGSTSKAPALGRYEHGVWTPTTSVYGDRVKVKDLIEAEAKNNRESYKSFLFGYVHPKTSEKIVDQPIITNENECSAA